MVGLRHAPAGHPRPRRRAAAALTGGLLALAIAFAPCAARARLGNPHLRRAKALLDKFKDRAALKALKKAQRWKHNTPKVHATIALYFGIALANLLRDASAKQAFARALSADKGIELPRSVSPKIRKLFEEAKSTLPKPEPRPKPRPTQRPKPTPKRAPRPRPGPDDAPNTQRPTSSSINWPAWIIAGTALAAAGAGVGLGLAASSQQAQAKDLKLAFSEAKLHHTRAKDHALIANILFGVAGATALTSTVLFFVGKERHRSRPDLQIRLAPGLSGAALEIEGAF